MTAEEANRVIWQQVQQAREKMKDAVPISPPLPKDAVRMSDLVSHLDFTNEVITSSRSRRSRLGTRSGEPLA